MAKGNGAELAPSAQLARAEIDGVTFRIRGLTSDETVGILDKSPEVAKMLSGVTAAQGGLVLDLLRAIKPVLEAGCDFDAEKQAAALKLPMQQQMTLALKILERTFPDEDGPFGAMVTELRRLMAGNVKVEALETSQTLSSGTSPN